MNELKPSFKQAVEFSMLWCDAWNEGELSDEVLADRVSELVNSENGARGFLAVSLSTNTPLIDRLPDSLVIQLRAAGDLIVDLTVKNLAMSTAMSIHHHRNSSINQQRGSERVTARCIDLLRVLDPNSVKNRLEKMLNGIEGLGPDIEFLKKWQYDKEQKLAIATKINQVADQ